MIKRSILALLILAASAFADFSFVHVSDIHVGAGKNPSNGETDARLFKEISALDPKPAMVVGTGDVCENGTAEQYAEYQNVLKSLSIPAYMATGNHDVRWNPLGKEGFTLGTHQPLFQSWDYTDKTGIKVHFVLLDSTVLLEHWGHFDQHMLDWLAADLKKTGTETPVVIGFHHGIGWDAVFADNEQQLMDLVEPYNIRLWLQGHGHADIQWNVNGVPAIEVAGLYQQSYAVISVTKDQLTVTRRMLGKPKDKGELLGGKAAPRDVLHKQILTIPLKKQPAPQWSATLDGTTLKIDRGSLPAESGLAYRVNTTKYLPMDASTISIDTNDFTAGEHVVTVQATLPDGRSYQKPLKLMIDKAGAPKPLWTTNIGGAVQSVLLRSGENVYLSTMGGDVVALSATDGKEVWRTHTGGAIFSSPIIDSGTIYVGSADHNVYALSADTGSVKWKYQTKGGVFASAAVAKGIVAIVSVDKLIYGLDATSGSLKWTAPVDGMYQSKAATDGERFFFAGWDNHLRCIDATTGKELWSNAIGKNPAGQIAMPYSPAIASPTYGDGQVFVSTNDGTLHAVDAQTGKENWTFCNKRLGYSGPLFHAGKVFTAIGDPSKVFCLDARTGKLLWMTGPRHPANEPRIASSTATPVDPKTPGSDVALPVIYDSSAAFGGGNIFIGSVDGTFNAINADTGELDWQYRLGPGHLLDSPATDDRAVYISSMSGRVTALPFK